MPSYLLDKSVARRIIEALHRLDNLSYEEELVLELWRHLQDEQARLFIPTGVVNILQRFAHLLEIHTFLAAVEPLESGRYLKRWARRLRRYNFTREDALVLALATYGTDMDGDIMGVDWLITLDRPFLQNLQTHRAELQIRLRAMTAQLQAPYRYATLPKVFHPDEMVF